MFNTSLVAVPALSLVDPAMTSGPTDGAMVKSTKVCSSVRGSQVTKMIFGSGPSRPCQRAAHERRHPARRHPDDDVTFRGFESVHRSRAFLVIVLDAFLRAHYRALAARHDREHKIGVGAKGGRHLGRFEDAQASAGAGAHEHDAAAMSERLRDDLDANRDALFLAVNRRQHLAVLVQHAFDDVGGGELVDVESLRVDGLGGKQFPFGTDRHALRTSRTNRGW